LLYQTVLLTCRQMVLTCLNAALFSQIAMLFCLNFMLTCLNTAFLCEIMVASLQIMVILCQFMTLTCLNAVSLCQIIVLSCEVAMLSKFSVTWPEPVRSAKKIALYQDRTKFEQNNTIIRHNKTVFVFLQENIKFRQYSSSLLHYKKVLRQVISTFRPQFVDFIRLSFHKSNPLFDSLSKWGMI
jgi:hypothetical protein